MANPIAGHIIKIATLKVNRETTKHLPFQQLLK
jgi:hypothetical protein